MNTPPSPPGTTRHDDGAPEERNPLAASAYPLPNHTHHTGTTGKPNTTPLLLSVRTMSVASAPGAHRASPPIGRIAVDDLAHRQLSAQLPGHRREEIAERLHAHPLLDGVH